MKGTSIRWRLTLWYAAVIGAMLGVFAVVVYGMMLRYATRQMDYVVREELVEMALQVEAAADLDDLNRKLASWFGRHETCEFEVSQLHGESVFRSDRLGTGRLLQSSDSVEVPETNRWDNQFIPGLGRYRVGSTLAAGRAGAFLLHAAFPWKFHEQQLSALLGILLGVGPVVLGVATWGGYVLAGRALAPIDRMVAVAGEITSRDLNRRVAVPRSNDELSRLARTLNAMLDRLHRAFHEVQRFTADAAHEMRTPLAVLRSTAEVALRTDRGRKDLQRALESMLEETVRMRHLSDQLLFLCREDSGVRTGTRRPVPIASSLKGVAAQMELLANEKGVTLEVGSLDPWVVESDDHQMRRLWYNLLDNAIKHTPPGGTVTISGRLSGDSAQIEIEDSGCGIPADELPHIFERFYRVDKSRAREQGGAGLGLAICKAIVESHQGEIQASSQAASGTCIHVRLPAILTDQNDARERNRGSLAGDSSRPDPAARPGSRFHLPAKQQSPLQQGQGRETVGRRHSSP